MCRSSTTVSEGHREPIPRDELIPVDPATARGGLRRLLAGGIVTLFLSVVVGTGWVDALHPAPRPEPVGAEKRRDDESRREARFADGTMARILEGDLRGRSRVRHEVLPLYALGLLRVLRESKPAVVVGEDDWLFLRSRAVPRGEPDEVVTGWGAAVLAALQRRVEDEAMRLVVAPIPRKAVVESRRLPRRIRARPELDGALVAQLRRRGVRCVDLLARFLEAEGDSPYLRLDTHWSPSGELVAAEEICRVAGILVPEERRLTEIRELPRAPEAGADLLALTGIEWTPRVARCFPEATYRPFEVVARDARRMTRGATGKRQRIALVGTSFSAKRSFPRFLAHFSGEAVANRAEEGETPLRTMAAFLDRLGDGARPEIVLLEIPMHFLLEEGGLSDAAAPFEALEPRGFTELVGFGAVQVSPAFRGERLVAGPVEWLATVPAWLVTHSGDGAAWVRVRGRVRGGPITLVVDGGAGRLRIPWPPERTEVLAPVLGWRPVGVAFLAVSAGAQPAYLELEEVAFGIDRDPSTGVPGIVAPPVALPEGRGWIQTVRFPAGARVPANGTVELEIDGASRLVEDFRVEVQPAGNAGSSVVWHLPAVVPGGRVVVGVGALEGREVGSLEIRGDGGPPAAFARACRLF